MTLPRADRLPRRLRLALVGPSQFSVGTRREGDESSRFTRTPKGELRKRRRAANARARVARKGNRR